MAQSKRNQNWFVTKNVFGEVIIGHPDLKNLAIAKVFMEGDYEENANLIAAAPDLLAALKQLLDDLDGDWVEGEHIEGALKAIQKASGKDRKRPEKPLEKITSDIPA